MAGFSVNGEETPALPVWGKLIEVHAAAGFKDNLLLQPSKGEASPFLNGGFDISLSRLPADGTEVQFFLNGDEYHYLSGSNVEDEQSVIGLAQVSRQLGTDWRASLPLQYFYFNEAFDASITETNLTVLRPQGHLLRARPAIRRNLPGHFWTEAEFSLSRQYFHAPLDDYWEGGSQLTIGYAYGGGSQATLSYQLLRRSYDSRTPLDDNFEGIPGRTLEYTLHTTALTWRHNWDAQRRWRTQMRLEWTRNIDNGSGFFNYDRFMVSQQIRYVRPAWEISGRVRLADYEYSRQTVSASDLSKRSRFDWLFNLRAERTLAQKLKIYGEFEHEEALSNRAIEQYNVNTVCAGVEWEF